MNFLKRTARFLIHPSLWFLTIIAFLASASLLGGTIIMITDELSCYKSLGISLLIFMGITVAYSIYGFIEKYHWIKTTILSYSKHKHFWNRLFNEYGFRAVLFSVFSFFLGTAFTIYNAVIAFDLHSIWFGALSVYYAIITIMRGGILSYHLKRRKAIKNGQNEKMTFMRDTMVYGKIGLSLIILPFVLSFAIISTVTNDSQLSYPGVTIYAFALYACYKVALTVVRIIKTRKSNEMTVKAITNIGIADALVSVLALQSAMIKKFNTELLFDGNIMNAITGASICVLTILIGIFMIIKTIGNIKKEAKKAVSEK